MYDIFHLLTEQQQKYIDAAAAAAKTHNHTNYCT
jgi:hypothetical protein